MIQKFAKTLLLFIFCIGNSLSAKESQSSPHIRYANEFTKSMAPLLEKEFNLECIGNGGSMPYNIANLSLYFVAQRRGSIEEARELQVRCTEKLLKAINSNEKIRPYLAEYPYTQERMHVSISFEAHDDFYADSTVAHAFSARGSLYYSKYDPITDNLTDLFNEPYPEALKIVQQSTLSNADLCSHKKKAYEDALDTLLDSCGREASKKWGVKCQGAGGEMSEGIKEFGFLFTKNKRVTIEEARKLEIHITDLILNKINSNEKLRPYLKTSPVPVDLVRVKILFQKSDTEDFSDGSLYSVLQKNNKVQYHVHDTEKDDAPTLFYPILIREESYDEALYLLDPTKHKKPIPTNINQEELPCSGIFALENRDPLLLQGKILNGRYYSPENVFSCKAEDFGEGKYITQDRLPNEYETSVSFYSPVANFKKAEVLFMPGWEKIKLDQQTLKNCFTRFGIEVLKQIDKAQGIEMLKEEMIGDNLFFTAISVEKIPILRDRNGKYLSCTRGYLTFQEGDKLILLINQEVTLPDQPHNPKNSIEKLKNEILEFRKTFEFGPTPLHKEALASPG